MYYMYSSTFESRSISYYSTYYSCSRLLEYIYFGVRHSRAHYVYNNINILTY